MADDTMAICSGCAGSGEGHYDGSVCMTCRGTGEIETDPDKYEQADRDYDEWHDRQSEREHDDRGEKA